MTALEICLNDKKIAVGGVSLGMVSAIVNWVKMPTYQGQDGDSPEKCGVSLGGLDNSSSEHLIWLRHDLAVGDEVRIRVVETESLDPPVERKPKDESAARGPRAEI